MVMNNYIHHWELDLYPYLGDPNLIVICCSIFLCACKCMCRKKHLKNRSCSGAVTWLGISTVRNCDVHSIATLFLPLLRPAFSLSHLLSFWNTFKLTLSLPASLHSLHHAPALTPSDTAWSFSSRCPVRVCEHMNLPAQASAPLQCARCCVVMMEGGGGRGREKGEGRAHKDDDRDVIVSEQVGCQAVDVRLGSWGAAVAPGTTWKWIGSASTCIKSGKQILVDVCSFSFGL